jgi:hypothetical protein
MCQTSQCAPNPRLQRTRSALLRSPLSRKPLGDGGGRLAILLLAGVLAACDRHHPSPVPRSSLLPPLELSGPSVLPSFLRNVSAADEYKLVRSPSVLDGQLQGGLEKELGPMAAPSEPYNTSCVRVPGLASRRLIVAAVSSRYVVVHFEEGGFVLSQRVFVFKRTGSHPAIPVWSNQTSLALRDSDAFLSALRSGSLWRG